MRVAFWGYAVQNQGEKHSPCHWNMEAGGMDVIRKSQVDDMVGWGQFLHPRRICEIFDIFSHSVL